MPENSTPHEALWTDLYVAGLNDLIASIPAEAAYRVGLCQSVYYQETGSFPPLAVLKNAASTARGPREAFELGRFAAREELKRRERRDARRQLRQKGGA